MDPDRIREARLAAGLSLAEVAGDDFSRTLIHFIEHGRSQPSQRVLELIAKRTGKPVGYFLRQDTIQSKSADPDDITRDFSRLASRLRRVAANRRLSKSEREAMKMLDITLRQSAVLAATILKGQEPV